MVPPAVEQLKFLDRMQLLFAGSQFTSTYKFALIAALADAAVELGEGGRPLEIPIRTLAEYFVGMYWRQAAPYADSPNSVLSQNKGRQVAVVSRILEAKKAGFTSLAQLKHDTARWAKLLISVSKTVADQPVRCLPQPGMESFPFQRVRGGVLLGASEVYCFRKFHSLIVSMAQGSWLRWVRRRAPNQKILGDPIELQAFLFGSERKNLAAYRPILVDIQKGECFYCAKSVKGAGAVDHFIPWAHYPVDLGHNFVLAHSDCNGSKSDHLASYAHLERWCARNIDSAQELAERLDEADLPYDLGVSRRVSLWAYRQADDLGVPVWNSKTKDDFVSLDPRWVELLVA